MKRLVLCVLLMCVIISSCFIPPYGKAYATNIADNSVIILTGNVNEQNKLIIQANLTVNTGISGMTLELTYNKTAIVLSNIDFGTALSSLDPITTNTKTEAGYSITPFKFNYWGEENDFSKGRLFTLTFDILDSVKDGKYQISLKYSKNKDVVYYDNNGEGKTKNLYIDNTEIEIKNKSIVEINTVNDRTESSLLITILLCVVMVVVVVGVVFVVLYFLKKKRNWERI